MLPAGQRWPWPVSYTHLDVYKRQEFCYAEDCCKAAGAGLGFSVGWYIERRFINFDTRAALPAQILKVLIGLAVAITLQNGLKLVLGTTLPAHCIRYFILVICCLLYTSRCV